MKKFDALYESVMTPSEYEIPINEGFTDIVKKVLRIKSKAKGNPRKDLVLSPSTNYRIESLFHDLKITLKDLELDLKHAHDRESAKTIALIRGLVDQKAISDKEKLTFKDTLNDDIENSLGYTFRLFVALIQHYEKVEKDMESANAVRKILKIMTDPHENYGE
jgi:hypothetical protein